MSPLDSYPHVSAYLSSDPRQLPFAEHSFDAVLSCGVLEHVEDPHASLDEIRRVPVPGGTFYVYKLPNRAAYLEATARWMGLYYHGAYEHDRTYGWRTAVKLLRGRDVELLQVRRNGLRLTLTRNLAPRAARPFGPRIDGSALCLA